MSYLWVRNWERYQHYKDRNPPWIKFYVVLLDDPTLRELPYPTRLLWDQILLLAARYGNPIEADANGIAKLTRMDTRSVREGVKQLCAKRLLKETRTRRKPPSAKGTDASNPASTAASEPASKDASPRARPRGRERGEREEKPLVTGRIGSKTSHADEGLDDLPFENEMYYFKLLNYAQGGEDFDEGNNGKPSTALVIRRRVDQIRAESALASIGESCQRRPSRKGRCAYLVGALNKAILEQGQREPQPVEAHDAA